jgi:hypothetical protein
MRQASDVMVKRLDMQRVEVARQRIGLMRTHLALSLKVSTKSLKNWSSGIPLKRLPKLAKFLDVPEEWITSGDNPPYWYILKAMTSIKYEIDWSNLPKATIREAWWDVLDGALLQWLSEPLGVIHIPNHVRVQRWRFISSRRDSLLMQLDWKQLSTLARDLGVWPQDPFVQEIVQTSFPNAVTNQKGDASEDVARWQAVVDCLELGARAYSKARNDHSQQHLWQNKVWNSLMEQQPDEPLLTGKALIPVLRTCLRVARTTNILFGMSAQIESAVEKALVSEFQNRTFSLQELGQYLEHHRGLRLIGRGRPSPEERQRRRFYRDTVSEDRILDLLKYIEKDKILPLKSHGRKWVMGKAPILTPRQSS